MQVGIWSIVGLALIGVMIVGIVCLIVGLFRRMDALERAEEEAVNREG